jgi:Flp pilus assembly protein TadG
MSIRHVASELKTRLAAWGDPGRARVSYRRFLRGEGGAIAIYFGLSAIVFVGIAGLAVDAARGYLVKARLSQAIDAAALAGGKALQATGQKDNAKVIADANAFFDANFPDGAMGAKVANPTITIGNNNTTISVSSTAVIPTTLMTVLGFNNMTMAAAAKVARAQGGLDLVFSFDVSGSMNDSAGPGGSKIEVLKENATALVTSLYKPFTDGGQSQKVTVNGKDYYLLNIGVVPWNAKVNVLNYPAKVPGTYDSPSGGTFTNPTRRRYIINSPTGVSTRTMLGTVKAANSDVPLLLDPASTNVTVTKNGTTTTTNQAQVPGGWSGCVYARYTDDGNMTNDYDTTRGVDATWRGWEPIPNNEGNADDCYATKWNINQDYNSSVSGKKPSSNNGWWTNNQHGEDCTQCPKIGILRLQPDGDLVKTMIGDLVAGGNTDAPQGLFWAWEVLMPGLPFDEAVVDPPFQRAQAIVFMTDGQNVGGNGDAYHGWFGSGPGAGTLAGKGKIDLPDGSSVDNNLNNRLLQLAQKIKGVPTQNPLDDSTVKIYVIQYQEKDEELKTLLKKVATTDTNPYYFFAPDSAALEGIFTQIADSLSALRIVE